MTLDELKDNIPEFAKDIKLNFSSIIKNSDFDDDLVYGCSYASALALNDKVMANIFEKECQNRFGVEFVESVKSTVAIMTLNNVWYKYRDAMPNSQMKMAPQRMRVNVMANYAGLDKILFESLSLCISAINGCTFCIKSHSDLLIKNEKTSEFVFNIGRIASVISAISKVSALK